VSLYPGRTLDAGQVNAIAHLVASSVPELSARNVTVVDQAGNLLSGGPQGAPASALDAAQLKYLHAVEASYVSRIENILKPVVGPENVRAQVTAALDFSQVEQTSETFRPNGTPQEQSIRSQQTVETVNTNPQGPSGVPGALSNQPPGAASAPLNAPPAAVPGALAAALGAQPAQQSVNTHRENTVNYELDKTIRHVKGEVGAVKRLSAAVVVNYRRTPGQDGNVTQAPLSEQELAQLSELAREAMGFDKARGDTLNLVNAPFSAEPLTGVEPPSAWASALREASEPASVMQAFKMAVLALVIAFAWFGLIRPALRDLTRAAQTQAGGSAGAAGIEPQLAGAAPGAGEPAYEADLRAIKDLARQEPRVVANVVKDWVGRDE
jgi:flagellar M-ring protein FliF